MKRLLALAAALPLFASATAFAECNYPRAPERMPDGTTATLDDMKAAKAQVEQYNKAMETYLACIKTEHDDAITRGSSTLSEDQKKQIALMYAQKNDAAVDELQGVAARFNEQVRAYKKQSEKK